MGNHSFSLDKNAKLSRGGFKLGGARTHDGSGREGHSVWTEALVSFMLHLVVMAEVGAPS